VSGLQARKKDDGYDEGISVLELLLYIVIAAALILLAWFGLNAFLDKGKESAATQNLSSAYKIARIAKENERQFNGQFPPRAELVPMLNSEIGDGVTAVSSYSELDEMEMGIMESGGQRFVAGIPISGSRVIEISVELPDRPQFRIIDSSTPVVIQSTVVFSGNSCSSGQVSDTTDWIPMFGGDQVEVCINEISYQGDCSVGNTCTYLMSGTKDSRVDVKHMNVWGTTSLGGNGNMAGDPNVGTPDSVPENMGSTTWSYEFECSSVEAVWQGSYFTNATPIPGGGIGNRQYFVDNGYWEDGWWDIQPIVIPVGQIQDVPVPMCGMIWQHE
jgi:hypothetical protein